MTFKCHFTVILTYILVKSYENSFTTGYPGTEGERDSNDKSVLKATGREQFVVKTECGMEEQHEKSMNRFKPSKIDTSRDVVQRDKESPRQIVAQNDGSQSKNKCGNEKTSVHKSPREISTLMQCKIENPDSRDAWPTAEASSPAREIECEKKPTNNEGLDIAEWVMIPRRALKKAKVNILIFLLSLVKRELK